MIRAHGDAEALYRSDIAAGHAAGSGAGGDTGVAEANAGGLTSPVVRAALQQALVGATAAGEGKAFDAPGSAAPPARRPQAPTVAAGSVAAAALHAHARVRKRKPRGRARLKHKMGDPWWRDIKRKRRRNKHIKGRVIDGEHEQFALAIAMANGIHYSVDLAAKEAAGFGDVEALLDFSSALRPVVLDGLEGMLVSRAVPLPKQRAAAASVAPGASAAAAASSAAHPVPTVSSVAEAADYAALTGRQIEAVELLLEQHKRARAAGTAQGLLPLNVLPERTGGESKCDKRDRNNLVRLLRSIRDYRKVVVADTEFGKRSSRKLPRDVASILKAMGVSIAEIVYAKKTADRSSNSEWDVHDWRTRTAQSAEEHTGGVACWCVCRALSKRHIEPATPCIPS